jgi:translation elongation factor EF-Tu-like GTPase
MKIIVEKKTGTQPMTEFHVLLHHDVHHNNTIDLLNDDDGEDDDDVIDLTL